MICWTFHESLARQEIYMHYAYISQWQATQHDEITIMLMNNMMDIHRMFE